MIDLIVVGASGFGRELLQYAEDAFRNARDVRIKGFLDDDPNRKATGVGIVGDTLTYLIQEQDRFIISLGDPGLRRTLAARLACRGARFLSIIHPTAYVAPSARIGDGCIVAPFAVVGACVHVEDHVLLNVHSAVGHDVRIGAFSVFSPHSVANGGSQLDESIFLGTHAAITPNVRVGAASKIAAGAVVYRDVPTRSLATGNPAKAFPLDQAAPSLPGQAST